MVKDRTFTDRIFSGVSYTVVTFFTLCCLIPLWLIVVAAFTDEQALVKSGYGLWSSQWSLEAFQYVLRGKEVQTSYGVSMLVTVVGTLTSLLLMSALGYILSLRHFKGRNKLALFIYIPMIVGGGIVPWYITMKTLGLYNNLSALIVPLLISPWWVFVLRRFFSQLPNEVLESARVDGASDTQILFRIILPLSTPVIATVALFMAVGYWNDWFHGSFLLPLADFRPLAVLLLRINNNVQAMQQAVRMGADAPVMQIPAQSIRMATAVVTLGPIILVYPFAQKYFIRGLTLGSVKE